MDYSRALLVVCITLFIVVGINAAIYVSLVRRKGEVSQGELFRRAAQRARQPWEHEDRDLKELADLVQQLHSKKKDDQDG